jgi:molybdenum cofactor guanylyltransferase
MNLFSGAVLAGGRSSRFGSNKAEFIWQEKTLLEWALSSFYGVEDVMVIGQAKNTLARVIADEIPFSGALYGLARALEQALCPRVGVMACDMPYLSLAYWQFLEQFEADVVIAKNVNGQLEPLAAMYSKNCLGLVQGALSRGEFKLSGWWQPSTVVSVRVVEWVELEPFFSSDLFLNANTLEDLVLGG